MTTTTTGAPTGVAPGRPPRRRPPARRAGGGGGLGSYLLVRFLLIFPTIFILVTTVFVLMRSTGDPITAALGGRLPPDQLPERIHEAGYDRPLLAQYFEYLGNLAARRLRDDDLATTARSPRCSRPTARRPWSSRSTRCSSRSSSASRSAGSPPTRRDQGPTRPCGSSRSSATRRPVFFAGLLLKLVFSVWLGWLPVAGRASTDAQIEIQRDGCRRDRPLPDRRDQLGDPRGDPRRARSTRSCRRIALGLLTAGDLPAAGPHQRHRHARHGLRRGGPLARRAPSGGCCASTPTGRRSIPIITVIGLQIALLLSGAVLTETTFEWKGLGFQLVQYLQARDFVAVQGIVVLLAVIVALTNFIVDVIAALDRPPGEVLTWPPPPRRPTPPAPGARRARRRSGRACPSSASCRRASACSAACSSPASCSARSSCSPRSSRRCSRPTGSHQLRDARRRVRRAAAAVVRAPARHHGRRLRRAVPGASGAPGRRCSSSSSPSCCRSSSASLLGLVSGYFGGWVDRVLVVISDAIYAFPSLLLAIVVAIVISGGQSSLWGGIMAAAISITRRLHPAVLPGGPRRGGADQGRGVRRVGAR